MSPKNGNIGTETNNMLGDLLFDQIISYFSLTYFRAVVVVVVVIVVVVDASVKRNLISLTIG